MILRILAAWVCLAAAPSLLPAQGPDWGAVEAAIGRTGTPQAGGLRRFGFPRTDLRVTIGDLEIRPALALGGWVTFAPRGDSAVLMGDLVLTAEELGPVIVRLQKGGIGQTAIHHHLVGESPRVLYVHVHGHGNPVALARTIHAAVALTRIPPPSAGAGDAAAIALDTAALARTLGASGRVTGGVFQVAIPRREVIRENGWEVPATMGLGTVINFQPMNGGKAAITGDFVLIGAEVNPVMRILSEHGITPTSLHNHLLKEQPRLFFLHFWGVDDPQALARGLAAALDRTNSVRTAR